MRISTKVTTTTITEIAMVTNILPSSSLPVTGAKRYKNHKEGLDILPVNSYAYEIQNGMMHGNNITSNSGICMGFGPIPPLFNGSRFGQICYTSNKY